MQTSFLHQVSVFLKEKHPHNLEQVCLVMPNRRAMVFFKKHLQNTYEQPFIEPDICTFEDFLVRISGLQMADATELLFDFYQVYQSIEDTFEKESFEEFSRWGLTLMQDFNDLDGHYVDTSSFFKYVYEYFSLTQWSPDHQEFSDFQKRYLHFWKNIGTYYQGLQQHVQESGKAYQGYLLRKSIDLVKHANFDVFSKLRYTHVYFVGFNAVTTGEIMLMEHFLTHHKASVLFDADTYYIENQIHEAGHFLRMLLAKEVWKNNSKVFWSNGFKEDKQIVVEPIQGNVIQAKQAGQLLQRSGTALVLNDEDILLPVLNALPNQVDKTNITLGYPLKNTAFYLFFKTCFENFDFYEREGYYYYRHVLNLMSVAVSVFPERDLKHIKDLESIIIRKNLVRIYSSFLKSNTGNYIFDDVLNWQKNSISESLLSIDVWIEKAIEENAPSTQDYHQKMLLESLFQIQKILKQIRSYVLKYSFVNAWQMIAYVFEQQCKATSIPFIGEPLGGLQIMGMLETRLLDFEHVVILSVNEGFLPKEKFENSFIPFEIRRQFKISTHIEKDAVFSYHFYRLLQRAKTVHILYNTSSADDFSRSEPSRYISQLAYEWPIYNAKANLSFLPMRQSIPAVIKEPILVPKTEHLLDKIKTYLQEHGLSASALNTYLRCPLDFYNQYILGVKEEKEVMEDVEDKTLGIMIHKALENLYKPFVGELLYAHHIPEMLQKRDAIIEDILSEFYQSNSESLEGKAFLNYELIKQVVTRFLRSEKDFLETNSDGLFIEGLEQNKECHFTVSGINVRLFGFFDRIDQVSGITRIIDYKTGSLKDNATVLKEREKLLDVFKENKYDKIIQLYFYNYIYHSLNPNTVLKTGIISLKKIKDGLITLKVNGREYLSAEDLTFFETFIQQVISEMLDPKLPFQHKESSEYCLFC